MAYEDEVLADGPLLAWPLDETSGTVATDVSGNGMHGTYYGDVTFANLVSGPITAPYFNYGCVVLDDPLGTLLPPYTWECWALVDTLTHPSINSRFDMLFGKAEHIDAGPSGLTLWGQINRQFGIGVGNWTVSGRIAGSGEGESTPDNRGQYTRLVHIVFVVEPVDSSNHLATFYVDGRTGEGTSTDDGSGNLIGIGEAAFGWNVGVGSAVIGGTDQARLKGHVAWAALYPSALSEARVREHFLVGAGPITQGRSLQHELVTPADIKSAAPSLVDTSYQGLYVPTLVSPFKTLNTQIKAADLELLNREFEVESAIAGPAEAFPITRIDQEHELALADSDSEAFAPDTLLAFSLSTAESLPEAFGPFIAVDQELFARAAVSGGVAFGPRLRLAGLLTPDISVVLLRRAAPPVVVAELDQSFARQFYEEMDEVGSGSLTLTNDDPDLALLGDADLIRFAIRGEAAMTILANERYQTRVSSAEEAGEVTVISGPGHLAVLGEALVYPGRAFAHGIGGFEPPYLPDLTYLGLPRGFVEEDRVWDYTAWDYYDGGWRRATRVHRQGDLGSHWDGIPADWPASNAYWIFDHTATREWAKPGTCYFRRKFNAPSAGSYTIYFSADATGELYMDGVAIAENTYDVISPTTITTSVVELSEGDHLLAGWIENDVDPEGDMIHNPGGLLCAVYRNDQEGQPTGGPIIVSDNDWLILEFPAKKPGMPVGEVMRNVILEAQSRGALPGVQVGWTYELDSHGQPWGDPVDIATKIGTDLLTFFREVSATYIDFWMEPGSLTLRAYRFGTRGRDTTVTLHAPTNPTDPGTGNLLSLTSRRTTNPINNLLVRHHNGWSEAVVPRTFRKEAMLGLGALQSEDEVQRVTSGQLAIYADPREAIAAEIEPIDELDTPYLSFRVGDRITVPDAAGEPTVERVVAIGVTEDEDGYVAYRPELRDIILEAQERFAQGLKKMIDGTMGGDSKVATPVYAPRLARQSPVPSGRAPGPRELTTSLSGSQWLVNGAASYTYAGTGPFSVTGMTVNFSEPFPTVIPTAEGGHFRLGLAAYTGGESDFWVGFVELYGGETTASITFDAPFDLVLPFEGATRYVYFRHGMWDIEWTDPALEITSLVASLVATTTGGETPVVLSWEHPT